MAYRNAFCFLIAVISRIDLLLCKKETDEPFCTSRYDFESKLLKDMVKLDFDMSILKQRYSKDIEDFKSQLKMATEKLDTVTKELERAQESKVNELTTLGDGLKQEVDDKVQEVQQTKQSLEKDFAELYKNLEHKSDMKLEEIKAEASKPSVAFLVKTLTDISSGKYKVLKFKDSIYNTDSVYNHGTGYFTAPVNGTYMFSLQLCYPPDKYVHPQMVADEIIISNTILYDGDRGHPCSTINAIAILSSGSQVYARLGYEYNIGDILYQEDVNRWATFMGALLN